MNITRKHEQMWESLLDSDYRKQFIDEHINVGIAFQIRSLRERQKLTQTKLAELLGGKRKQPLISAWEDPNYSKYTLATLKDLAKAFDVGLLVRFVPFSTLVDWTINVTSDTIAPPSFNEENCPTTVEPEIATDSLKNIIWDATQLSAFWNTPFQLTDSSLGTPKTNEDEKQRELVHA